MKCTNAKMGQLITRYELNLVSDEERRSFDDHLLKCDACYQDLYEMGPVVELMTERHEQLLAAIKGDSVEVRTQDKRAETPRAGVGALIKAWLERPKSPVWASAGVFAVALLAVVLLAPAEHTYRDLASIEPFRAIKSAIPLRGGNRFTFFEQGREAYEQGHYSQAVEAFAQANKLEPKQAKVMLYLGLSYLSNSGADSAASYLRQVTGLDSSRLGTAAHWYLGNLLLAQDDAARAKPEFEAAVARGGDYREQAARTLARIEQRKNESIFWKKLKYVRDALPRVFKTEPK